eukprot:11965381-Heterocapsa_arctica.AAC.1
MRNLPPRPPGPRNRCRLGGSAQGLSVPRADHHRDLEASPLSAGDGLSASRAVHLPARGTRGTGREVRAQRHTPRAGP